MNATKPLKLRVVTATLGDSQYWKEAAASVAAAAPSAEHLVICPANRVKAIAASHPSLRVVAEKKAAGLYVALNQALHEPGDWDAFTWLNDDDLLVGPGFGTLWTTFQLQPEIGVMYGRVDLIDGKDHRVAGHPVARRADDLAPLLARGIVPFAQPGTVIRREWFKRLDGFHRSYQLAGDFDFFGRALLAGARFDFGDDLVAKFRLRAGQLSKRRAEMEAETKRALEPFAAKPRPLTAWWRFRRDNFRLYLDRIRRHGFRSMREIYDKVE